MVFSYSACKLPFLGHVLSLFSDVQNLYLDVYFSWAGRRADPWTAHYGSLWAELLLNPSPFIFQSFPIFVSFSESPGQA